MRRRRLKKLIKRLREDYGVSVAGGQLHLMGKIFRLALHITQNREDGEDVLQETFLKAYEHLDQFQGQSKFYTWIVRIDCSPRRPAGRVNGGGLRRLRRTNHYA